MQEIISQIAQIESTLTNSLLGDMDANFEIHQLKKKLAELKDEKT